MASPEVLSTATPQAPPVPSSDSPLAPLLIGIRGPERGSSLSAVVATTCNVVPAITTIRKRLEGRKAVATAHTREIVLQNSDAGNGYRLVARCIDRAPGETASQAFGRWVWEVGFVAFAEGYTAGPLTAEHECFRADVTRFKLYGQSVVAAQQLALFRHLVAKSFSALDPGLVILGGQCAWEAAWWPNPAPA